MKNYIEVMKPITVPYSNYCYDLDNKELMCQYFWCGKCLQEFNPEYLPKENKYLKDQKCKNLIFKENIK